MIIIIHNTACVQSNAIEFNLLSQFLPVTR